MESDRTPDTVICWLLLHINLVPCLVAVAHLCSLWLIAVALEVILFGGQFPPDDDSGRVLRWDRILSCLVAAEVLWLCLYGIKSLTPPMLA